MRRRRPLWREPARDQHSADGPKQVRLPRDARARQQTPQQGPAEQDRDDNTDGQLYDAAIEKPREIR